MNDRSDLDSLARRYLDLWERQAGLFAAIPSSEVLPRAFLHPTAVATRPETTDEPEPSG